MDEQNSWLQTVAQLRQHGRLEEALRFCESMLQSNPDNTDAMGYRAMLLYELSRPEAALEAYQSLAISYASQGDFLQALTTAKEMAMLDAQASARLTAELSQRYHDEVSPAAEIPTQDLPPAYNLEATHPSLPSFPGSEELDEEQMLERLLHLQSGDIPTDELDIPEEQVESETSPEMPPPLPPLFHQLDAASTAAIWQSMETLRLEPNARIIQQGESGSEFYIIVDGTVVVTHEVEGEEEELGHLGPGQFFGEIALMTSLRRTAHVTTISKAKILRLERASLEKIIQGHPKVHQELQRFVYQRLIHNLLVSSLIFFPLSDIKRWELAQQFIVMEVPADYTVLTEGDPADGLYLIAGGKVDLEKEQAEGPVLAGTLGPGQFYGELSLLTRVPSPCSMVAREPTTFLKLQADNFYRVMDQYPRVSDLLQAVAAQRSRELSLMEAPEPIS